MSGRGDCERVSELLPEFLAGRLTDEAAARVRDHLEVCPECADRANAVGLLQETPVPAPDPQRWGRFVEGVVEVAERRRRRRRLRRWVPALLLAAAVLVALLLWRGLSTGTGLKGEPRLEALAREAAGQPESEAQAWTVGVVFGDWMPVAVDGEDLSTRQIDDLVKEVNGI